MSTATSGPELLSPLVANGSTIQYADSGGDGEPVLLIHAGVFGSWFEPLAATSSLRGLRVIRMVRAGYTGGPAPLGPLSIADHAGHAAALLDAIGSAPAYVVAHSSGSVIALQLALDRPDLVAGMVLSEPPLIDSLTAPQDLEFLHTQLGPVIGAAIGAAAAGDVPAGFETFMSVVCGSDYRRVLAEALGPDALVRAEQDSRFFFTDEIKAAGEWRFDEPTAAKIACPVLLVQGDVSPPPVHRLVARLAAMLPGGQVTSIEREDHLLPLRSPDALGRVVAEFVRGHLTKT